MEAAQPPRDRLIFQHNRWKIVILTQKQTRFRWRRFGVTNELTPEEEGKAALFANDYATSIISGNYSRTGAGGIGGNGTMYLGRAAYRTPIQPASTSLNILKEAHVGQTEQPYEFQAGDWLEFQLMEGYEKTTVKPGNNGLVTTETVIDWDEANATTERYEFDKATSGSSVQIPIFPQNGKASPFSYTAGELTTISLPRPAAGSKAAP